jgi:hypothetical protein
LHRYSHSNALLIMSQKSPVADVASNNRRRELVLRWPVGWFGWGEPGREVVAALLRRGGQERGAAHTIAERDAMNTALERLVTAVMARDDIPRSEAQHFVVLLLEELREVIEERPVPFRDFTPDDYRVNAQLDFQLAAH